MFLDQKGKANKIMGSECVSIDSKEEDLKILKQ